MAGPAVAVFMMACALMLTVCPPGLSHAEENLADAPDGRIIRKVEQDTNQDGRVDQIAHLDGSGNPVLLEIDASGDGRMDTRQHYTSGALVRIETQNSDPSPMTVIDFFEDGRRTRHQKQSPDGRVLETIDFDDNDQPLVREQDTTGDGQTDTVYRYRDGNPVLREEDTDHDGEMDRFSEFDDQGRPVRQNIRKPGRKTPVKTILFDGQGRVSRVEADTTSDGRFDTVQRFDDLQWSLVIEIHDDGGVLRERRAYAGEILRVKEVFDPDTGRPTLVEKYDEKGRISLTREALKNGGPLDMTWHYDENEVAVTAERDTSGDGHVDTWYYYVDDRIDRVAEDRNQDGKPDLWETYDASGAIISNSEDINLDGTPDMKKTY